MLLLFYTILLSLINSTNLDQECNKIQKCIDKGNITNLDNNVSSFINHFNSFFEQFINMTKKIQLPVNEFIIKEYYLMRNKLDNIDSKLIIRMLNYYKVEDVNSYNISMEDSDNDTNKVCCNSNCIIF